VLYCIPQTGEVQRNLLVLIALHPL